MSVGSIPRDNPGVDPGVDADRELLQTRPSAAKAVQLAQDILQLHEEHNHECTRFQSKIRDLISQVDTLCNEKRALQAALNAREATEAKMKAEIAELKSELDSMWEDAAPMNKKEGKGQVSEEIAELRAQLENKASANNGLVKEIADFKAQLKSKAEETGDQESSFVGFSSDSIFLQEKGEFIRFMQAIKANGREGREYKQMYHFLLKCFTDADNNFDGRVGFLEFETLIDAAAFLPRRFGYAPSTPELYPTDFDRVRQRLQLFNSLKPRKAKALKGKTGTYDYISFDTWLQYAITHINEKAALLKDANPHSQMLGSHDEFQEFMLKAVESRNGQEYKELYHLVLKCFVDADKDLDGLITSEEFNSMLDSSSVPPRLQSFLPDGHCKTTEEKYKARSILFKELDSVQEGLLSFDTWLEYIYAFVCTKATDFGSAGVVPEIESAGTAKSEPKCPWRV